MEAVANLAGSRVSSDVPPISVIQPCADESSNEYNMAPRRQDTEEEFTTREVMHNLMLAQTSCFRTLEMQAAQPKAENGNGATNRRVTWLMAIFAMVTLLGTGANFLTSSGFVVGGKAGELGQTQKDVARIEIQEKEDRIRLQTEHDKLELRLREYEVWLQTTREKLADRGWKLPPLPKGIE